MLLDEDARREGVAVVAVGHGHDSLIHDGAAVGALVDEVHGAARDAHAVIEGLALGVDAREGGIEIALCAAPSDQDHPARLIRPEEIGIELRGGGHASRQINSIVPPGFDCHRLVCVEVYTPAGNWSSYPPHKHDTHRTAADGTLAEADLEEIYFYKIRDPRGFAIQRVYNDDRSLDATLAPGNNDIVLVPEGYHPVSAPVGYDCYYLNFLAGSAQSLAATDDPDHSWIKGELGGLDPRVPMVDLSMEAPR